MKLVNNIYLLVFVSLVTSSAINAQEDGSLRWYSYEKGFESYVPAIETSKNISFFVPLNTEHSYLKISLPRGSSIFVENTLVETNESNQIVIKSLSLDSLQTLYSKDSLFFTIYCKNKLVGLQTQLKSEEKKKTTDQISTNIRANTNERDFVIIGILISLILIALWRQQASVYDVGNLNLYLLFTSKSRENTMYNTSYFQLENVKFFGITSVLISLIVIHLREELPAMVFYYVDNTLFLSIFSWLVNALAYYIIFYFKFITVAIVSEIYSFRNFRYVHFYDFVRIVYFTSLVIFVMIIVDFISYGKLFELGYSTIMSLLLIVVITHIVITYQKLNKLFSNKKLHLFSYLCVTEIIPIVLIIKISGQ